MILLAMCTKQTNKMKTLSIKITTHSSILYILSLMKMSSSRSLLVILLSAASTMLSEATMPRQVPAWPIASIAYSTCNMLQHQQQAGKQSSKHPHEKKIYIEPQLNLNLKLYANYQIFVGRVVGFFFRKNQKPKKTGF